MDFVYNGLLGLVVVCIASIYVQIGSLFALVYRGRNTTKRAQSHNYCPFVSILKPVKGVDEGAYKNFVSFCRLDYPHYEIVFGVTDKDDPVIPLIRRLCNEFPNVPIKLVISNDAIGQNPKVNNLENAYREAKGEVIVMSDSDVRAETDYLYHAITPLEDKGVGMVTAVVMAHGARNFWAGAHALLVNGGIGSVFSIQHQLGRLDMAYGPSVAMRREVLEEVGGFARVANVIGEDILIGQMVKRIGYKVVLQSQIVKVVKHYSSLAKQYALILRWLIVIGKHAPALSWGIPIFFAFPFSLLNFLIFRDKLSLSLLVFALVSRWGFMTLMSLKFVKDKSLLRYLYGSQWGMLVFLHIWLKSLISNRVVWRGRYYEVYSAGRMKRVDLDQEEEAALVSEAA